MQPHDGLRTVALGTLEMSIQTSSVEPPPISNAQQIMGLAVHHARRKLPQARFSSGLMISSFKPVSAGYAA